MGAFSLASISTAMVSVDAAHTVDGDFLYEELFDEQSLILGLFGVLGISGEFCRIRVSNCVHLFERSGPAPGGIGSLRAPEIDRLSKPNLGGDDDSGLPLAVLLGGDRHLWCDGSGGGPGVVSSGTDRQ